MIIQENRGKLRGFVFVQTSPITFRTYKNHYTLGYVHTFVKESTDFLLAPKELSYWIKDGTTDQHT